MNENAPSSGREDAGRPDHARGTAGRTPGRSWLRWAPKGFVIGLVIGAALMLLLRPWLEDRAVRGISQGAMFSAFVLDWSRWREFRWQVYAVWSVVIVAGYLAVWYLMPQ